MTTAVSERHKGWVALAAFCTLMAIGAVANAAAQLLDGDWIGLLWLLYAIPFWYWIGVGAWRRSAEVR